MSSVKHYRALDAFHHNGVGTKSPKNPPFPLNDDDAKFLTEAGLVKSVDSVKFVQEKKIETAPENKKIIASLENKKTSGLLKKK